MMQSMQHFQTAALETRMGGRQYGPDRCNLTLAFKALLLFQVQGRTSQKSYEEGTGSFDTSYSFKHPNHSCS